MNMFTLSAIFYNAKIKINIKILLYIEHNRNISLPELDKK